MANNFHAPSGNDAPAIARTLATPSVSLLSGAKLTYYDAVNPPPHGKWTWDTAHNDYVPGRGCKDG